MQDNFGERFEKKEGGTQGSAVQKARWPFSGFA
jgi:hypothetical protein